MHETVPPSSRHAPALPHAPASGPAWHRKLVVMVSAHTTTAIMILTSEKIIEVHRLIISNFGGVDGVLCHGTIDYLVDQINAENNPNAAKNRQLPMQG